MKYFTNLAFSTVCTIAIGLICIATFNPETPSEKWLIGIVSGLSGGSITLLKILAEG